MLGPLLATAASIGSSLLNANTARKNTDLTNKANRELAEYQYSKDLEMWNRGNAYNDPINQMDRLKKAGLNPNLVYGNGAVGNTASQLPKYNAPRMDYNYLPKFNPMEMLSYFQDFRMKNAQIDNVKADTLSKVLTAEYKEKSMADALELLTEKRIITSQQRDQLATILGWWNQTIGSTPQTKGQQLLESQLQSRQAQTLSLNLGLEKIRQETRLRAAEADFYDWGAWSRLLQGFGLKLPSFRK